MKQSRILALCLLFCSITLSLKAAETPYLKAISLNIWSGSDYQGTSRFGMWETPIQREQRYQILLSYLKTVQPDIIFLQEANPVDKYALRLSEDLNLDEIHQVCIAGVKIFGLGIPYNFKEGNVILAKKRLLLSKIDDWKLSGSPGIYSDNLSIHFNETVSALVGQVIIEGKPINLVCVHLSAAPEQEQALRDSLDLQFASGQISSRDYKDLLALWQKGIKRREKETSRLLRRIKQLPKTYPIMVGGDFNATPQSKVIRDIISKGGFAEITFTEQDSVYVTWDAQNNTNTFYAQRKSAASGHKLDAWSAFNASAAGLSRRLDYIFPDSAFVYDEAPQKAIVLTTPQDGVYASDHYGIEAKFNLDRFLQMAPLKYGPILPNKKSTWSGGLFAMYDTNTGFGYGAKGFIFNLRKLNESIDLTLFNSTKGERWYKLAYSSPDRELRQTKKYDSAWDFIIDYDKWVKNNFFGFGSATHFGNREYYTKEILDVSLATVKQYSKLYSGLIGLRFKDAKAYNFEEGGLLDGMFIEKRKSSDFYSIFGSFIKDSRSSLLNPSHGFTSNFDLELTGRSNDEFNFGLKKDLGALKVDYEDEYHDDDSSIFIRYALNSQYYKVLWYPQTILALRFQWQHIFDVAEGDNHIPLLAKLPLGGGSTLRGSPQDRYLGSVRGLANAEIRYPIYKRLGGIAGWDAGKVWYALRHADFQKWPNNPVVGLRFYMTDFVVRLDVGFGLRTTGIYFNFGQAF